MNVVVRGQFDVFSQSGQDTVDTAVCLAEAGVKVTVMPTRLVPGLPRPFTRLLEQDPRGHKDLLVQVHWPEPLPNLQHYAERMVAYSPALDRFDLGWDGWVSPYPVEGLERTPAVVPVPVDLRRWKFKQRDWSQKPRVLLMTEQRQEPLERLITDAGLECLHAPPPMSNDEALVAMHEAHALLSLTAHDERLAAKFMATGGVVVGHPMNTALHPDVSLIVDSLDVAGLGSTLERLKDGKEMRRLAGTAPSWAQSTHGMEAVGERWQKVLSEVAWPS